MDALVVQGEDQVVQDQAAEEDAEKAISDSGFIFVICEQAIRGK